MAGKKKDDATPAPTEFVAFDIKGEGTVPNDGDLCEVKLFDAKLGKQVTGPLSVFDAKRGVFFKEPQRDDEGNMVNTSSNAIGTRRDNYKADRVRNVTEFKVVKEAHDPNRSDGSVIDHRRGLEHASARPPAITTPPDRD